MVVIQFVEACQDVFGGGVWFRVLFQQREEGSEFRDLRRNLGWLPPTKSCVRLPNCRTNLFELHIAQVRKHRGEDVAQHSGIVDVSMRRLLFNVHRVEAELLMVKELDLA